jgi:hypothetical protein
MRQRGGNPKATGTLKALQFFSAAPVTKRKCHDFTSSEKDFFLFGNRFRHPVPAPMIEMNSPPTRTK